MLILRSHIGWPSPHKTDTARPTASPLGADEVAGDQGDPRPAARRDLLGPRRGARLLPAGRARRARRHRRAWEGRLDGLDRRPGRVGRLPGGQGARRLGREAAHLARPGDKVATRRAINACLNAIVDVVPGLVAGGADLTGNTGTKLDDVASQSVEHPEGRQIHFGIREHAMGGIMNGMALHGGVLPVGGTFFVFSDYMRGVGPARRPQPRPRSSTPGPTTRSASARTARPTSPSSSWPSLRAMPGLRVIRPADANETAHALRVAVDRDGPDRLDPVPPDRAGPGRHRRARPTTSPEGPTSSSPAARTPTSSSSAPAARCRSASTPPRSWSERRHRRPGGVHAVLGAVRGAGRRLPGRGARLRRPGALRRGGRLLRMEPLGGRLGRPSTTSGRRRPAPVLLEEFGFTPDNVAERARAN